MRLTFAGAIVLISSAIFTPGIGAASPHVNSEPNRLAVDADPSAGGIQSSIAFTGTQTFSIDIEISAASIPYRGYQLFLAWPDSGLSFVSDSPDQPDGLTACTSPGRTTEGTSATLKTACVSPARRTTSFTGPVENLTLRCAADGTFVVHVVSVLEDLYWGSTMLDADGSYIATAVDDVTITCTRTGNQVRFTPAPLASRTPQPSPTATSTTTTPGLTRASTGIAGRSTVIVAPSTGFGPGSASNKKLMFVAIAALGAILTLAGATFLKSKR